MAKKKFDLNARSKPMTEVIEEFEGRKETIDAVKIFEKEPSKENTINAIKAVESSEVLSLATKNELKSSIQEMFVKAFNSNTLPIEYSELKSEVKYLADLHQVSGLYMAQRLVVIRDEELYKEDDYNDFKSFIESELTLSRSTVYNYIDIVDQFVSKRLDNDMEKISNNKSKLVPFIPLLKSEKLSEEQKETIRDNVIKDLESKSFRELTAEAKEFKIEYGLIHPSNPNKEESKIFLALKGMFSDVKKDPSHSAKSTFLIVLEHMEIAKLISGKELGTLAREFNSFEVKNKK